MVKSPIFVKTKAHRGENIIVCLIAPATVQKIKDLLPGGLGVCGVGGGGEGRGVSAQQGTPDEAAERIEASATYFIQHPYVRVKPFLLSTPGGAS